MFNLRRDFLLDPDVIFLNHGSFGATPKPVFRAYQRWQRELERQPVEFLGRRSTELMADSRTALGKYLGTHADNLVYTQNVTISINIVARSLDLGVGDEVLSSDHEYGAMERTWRFLYARPEAQSLLKPLVVSWGYEAELPGPSQFVDHNEWWGTRDLATFLSVPAAIEFQQKHGWDKVRVAGHALAREAEEHICSLTGLPSLSLGVIHSAFHPSVTL